jgi:hypothetical protein
VSPLVSVNSQNDADLAAILSAWPSLSATVRAALSAMATASAEKHKAR